MNTSIRKFIGVLLALAIIVSLALPGAPVFTEAEAASATITRPAATDVQNGVTLHCWNWSFKNIEANMAKIAGLGYTCVQVSPIQMTKQPTMGSPVNDWWAYYQPADFSIDNTGVSALGTKADFQSLCETAHEYGIYVIVDVVANHMAQDGATTRSPSIIDDLLYDDSCWHNKNTSIGSDYSSRERITQYDLDSVLDLNTASDKVQTYVLNYLKECIDAGADGFRFDAVKHIETPDDPSNIASDFWPTVIYGAEEYAETKGLDLYCYGELLDHPDTSGTTPDSAYTKYFSITDNSWGNSVRSDVVCGGSASSFGGTYHKNASANQLVLWAESHDTFSGNGSNGVSVENINKTWALVSARADAMSLYLARRQDTDTEVLGDIYMVGWFEPEVAAANKFHNAFVGQSEYVANSGSIAYVERGTSGVVLVNVGGNGTSVSVPANQIANGTYVDQISGNTFTVSGGKITGTIGDTGIAVVYNAEVCAHASHNEMGFCTACYEEVGHSYTNGTCSCGAVQVTERVIYFTNSDGWSTVNVYAWSDTTGEYTGEWPGSAMTNVSGNVYSYTVPGGAEKIIFNDGTNQTTDLTIPTVASGLDMYVQSSASWTSYGTVDNGCDHADHRFNGNCRACGTYVGHVYEDGYCACGAEETYDCHDYYLYGYINGANLSTLDDNFKFSGGKLTVNFSQDSYVAVRTYHGTYYQTKSEHQYTTSAPFYNASMITGASMMKIPGNQDLTLTFKTNFDGTYTLSYAAAGPVCAHSSHSTSGVCADCGETVSHSYVGGTCTVCGKACAHNSWTNGACSVCGTACSHSSHSTSGFCATCSSTVSHSYVDGVCSVCGYEKPADKVIYFDNTAGWTTVNIYAWNSSATVTSEWPGSAMTKVEGSIYSFTLSGEATMVIFNNGNDQTDNLTVPTDGSDLYTYSTNTWSVYDFGSCSHSWNSGTITTVATCTTAGVKTYTCSSCGETKTESIAATGHSYVDGICSSCGEAEPVATEKVLYFQNTAGWTTPYIYAWNDDGTCAGDWPGTAMTAVSGVDGLYQYTVSSDAVNVIFNNGSGGTGNQTADLTIPTDSNNLYTYSTGVWSVYTPPVPRVIYFQNTAGWTTPHIYAWTDATHYAGTWPGSAMTKVDGVDGLYMFELSPDAVNVIFNNGNGTKTDDLTIPTDGKDLYTYSTGVWSTYEEEAPCEHPSHDTNGNCTDCGEAVEHSYTSSVTAPTCTASGYTTYTCSVCGDSYTGNTTAATGHSYSGGTCTACGAADPDAVTDPGLKLSYPTLSFEDEIIYNVYYSVSDMTSVVEMGLMLLPSMMADGTMDDAIGTVPGYVTNGTVYLAKTEGIAAANMGDTVYFKVYAKLTDGTYAYSNAGGYNAKAYANTVLGGDYTDAMKSLVVAMVNYGAEAQLYFGHNTDKLVNSALTDEQKALVATYDESMVDAVVSADSSKTGNFVRVNSNFKQLYPSVSFDGAFSINFYCTPAITVDSGMTLYYWDTETYASIDEFTVDNATGSMEMTATNGQYWGNVPGIAAKDMDKTYYVSCVFESEGETITTGIIAYSLGKYCEGKAATDGDAQQAFAQATAVYGYYAKQYFASIA